MIDVPLILFAKVPIAGQVKTRLHSHCTPQQAKQIAEILLEQTVKRMIEGWPGRVVLAIWPAQEDAFIARLRTDYNLQLIAQEEGDLGQKMVSAMQQVGFPCVAMGCDVPHCPEAVLQYGHERLLATDNVIGPSVDGGYYLLGLQQSTPALFKSISWGSDRVLAQTVEIARRHNIELTRLPELNDIDEWADLQNIAPRIPALARFIRDEF